MKIINTFLCFSFLTLSFFSCVSGIEKVSMTIGNDSKTSINEKPVIIKRSELELDPGELIPLLINRNGETIPSQVDDLDGDGSWDELFFLIDLQENEKAVITINWVKELPNFEKRTNVRFGKRASRTEKVNSLKTDTLSADKVYRAMGYQPYQTDGPFWENDKVGFRHYFDGRNSTDIFGKKVAFITPDSVGINALGAVEDNYHVMWDWGRDILMVGNSVGIGGFGIMVDDKITRLGITNDDTLNNIEKTIFNIVSNGPLRTIMDYDYQNWKVEDRIYYVKETTTIWPGMYGYMNTVKISGLKDDETLLVGLVNSNTDKDLTELEVGEYVVLFTHDKQTYDKIWYLGMAIILPKEYYTGNGEASKTGSFSNTYFGKLKIDNEKPVSYYAVACWEIADSNFSDKEYFKQYLMDLTRQLSTHVSLRIE